MEKPAAPGLQPPVKSPTEFLRASHSRILIVEDNPVNQIVASRALRTLGYTADIVSGGEAALDVMRSQSFDLILMDCQMPGMDGYQTTAEIRRLEAGRGRTPIVAMTANSVAGDRERCIEAGMDDYLPKPFRVATLQSTLQRWLYPAAARSVA